MEPPEEFALAAIRECKEEGGIDVKLKGIIKVQQVIGCKNARVKVVFLAEPIDPDQPVKTVPDSESLESRWVTIPEMKELGKKPPYMRGDELITFGHYLQNGGRVYPLDIIQKFSDFRPYPILEGATNQQLAEEN